MSFFQHWTCTSTITRKKGHSYYMLSRHLLITTVHYTLRLPHPVILILERLLLLCIALAVRLKGLLPIGKRATQRSLPSVQSAVRNILLPIPVISADMKSVTNPSVRPVKGRFLCVTCGNCIQRRIAEHSKNTLNTNNSVLNVKACNNCYSQEIACLRNTPGLKQYSCPTPATCGLR